MDTCITLVTGAFARSCLPWMARPCITIPALWQPGKTAWATLSASERQFGKKLGQDNG